MRSCHDPKRTATWVNILRRTDNYRNWFYLARDYLFLGLVVGLMLAFYHWLFTQGWSWLYALPITLPKVNPCLRFRH